MARLLSLLIGGALAFGLLFLPAARGRELTGGEHGAITLALLAVCALFVHGSGFRFRRRWLQRLFSPWLLWPIALLFVAMVLLAR
ncbi:MAG: Cyd operon protein YbgE [Proteobacteria bacterium]|nr:Cyd operon protein YbgE [Pseudomonadota bacterium]MBS0217600.1 Cyd operon protein YbgE [Pseudomonadota bacterium]